MSVRKQSALGPAARAAIVAAALCLGTGCSFTEDKAEAQQLAEQYFAKMQAGDVEGVLSFYSARFYEVTPRADWRTFLENQRTRCGTPKTHSLTTWNVFNSIGTNAGSTTTLVYDVQYENCQVSEKITFFKPAGGAVQIQGHFMQPKAGTPSDKLDSQATLKT